MSTDWIEAVMRMNSLVVAAEARFNTQVDRIVATAERMGDWTQEEALLASSLTSLALLRAIQTQLLQNITTVTP